MLQLGKIDICSPAMRYVVGHDWFLSFSPSIGRVRETGYLPQTLPRGKKRSIVYLSSATTATW